MCYYLQLERRLDTKEDFPRLWGTAGRRNGRGGGQGPCSPENFLGRVGLKPASGPNRSSLSRRDAGPGPAAGGAEAATLQAAAVGRAPDLQPPPRPTFRAGGPRAPRATHLPAGAQWSPAASARGRALSPRRLDWWLCWRGHRPRAHRTRPAGAAAPPFWPGAPLEPRLKEGTLSTHRAWARCS